MNGTSFLLLFVFLVAGYVIHPLALPKLQEKGYGKILAEEETEEQQATDESDAPNAATDLTPEPAAKPAPRVTDEPIDPAPMPEPAPTPELKPESMPDATIPAPSAEEEVEPEPEPAPEPAPATNTFNDAQLVAAMQNSIKSGSITEFSFDQVNAWKSAGEETINGEDYKVGVASYTAKTLFGEQTHEAKALFKDGKLVKWVWAVNNFEMK